MAPFILLCIGAVVGAVWLFARRAAWSHYIKPKLAIEIELRRQMLRLVELEVFGDFPAVPAEMRTGQPGNQLEPGGGVRDGASPSVTHNDIAHRDGAVTP